MHLLAAVHIAHWMWSGKTISPLEPSEAAEIFTHGIVNAGLVLFALLLLGTLVLGRFFCGWACHVVAYQDLAAWLLKKMRIQPRPVRSRVLRFAPLGAAAFLFARPLWIRLRDGIDLPPLTWEFQTTAFWETFSGPTTALITFAVDGFLLVYFLGSKGFCTYGCPYGALFAPLDRLAPGRIRVTDACEGCGHCTAVCTSNVRVHEEVALHRMVVDPGCMKCMDCVNVCPKDALYYGVGRTALQEQIAPRNPKARHRRRPYDLSWGEEGMIAAVFAVASYALYGLYGLIPLMLCLGLAVLIALLAITVWRLLRQRELTVQHLSLRREGKLLPAGRGALLLALVVLPLIAHSSAVQFFGRRGMERLEQFARGDAADPPQRLADARRDLQRADQLGLLPDDKVLAALGATCERQGDWPAAEAYLRRAIERDPTAFKYFKLSSFCLQQKNTEQARGALLDALALDPAFAEAEERLQKLDALLQSQSSTDSR